MTHGAEVLTSEDGVLEWTPIDAIYKLPLVEDLPILLPRIIAARRDDPPFFALYTYNGDEKLAVSINECS